MTVLDIPVVCKELDIKYEDYSSAFDKRMMAFDMQEYEDYPKYLTPAEIRALVRWEKLDKRFPELFDSEGYIGPR